MREIKFRAWDKEKQFMFAPTQIEIAQGENFSKWDKWRPMVWRDELSEEGSGGIGRVLGDECELMQYTGLKDKNGKEIYEGDIVKYSFKDGEHVNTRFMQIYNDGVNFKMKELYRNYWLEKVDGVLKIKHGHLTKYKGDVNLLCDVSTILYWYEVIGNIYENPELLEENYK